MIKKITFIFLFLGLLSIQSIYSENFVPGYNTVTAEFDKVPKTLDEFIELRNELATTPAGGATAFIAAMQVFLSDNDLGMLSFSSIIDDELLQKIIPGGYEGMEPILDAKKILRKIMNQPTIANSYIFGTSSEDGYVFPEPPYICYFFEKAPEYIDDNTITLYISTSGAEIPRAVTVRKDNEGLWKVFEFKSLFQRIN